ncbi:hypothetical protein Bpfe_022822, partial [Biomphalaria pfeifferi]
CRVPNPVLGQNSIDFANLHECRLIEVQTLTLKTLTPNEKVWPNSYHKYNCVSSRPLPKLKAHAKRVQWWGEVKADCLGAESTVV